MLLGKLKFKYSWQIFILSITFVVSNFMKNLFTAKSSARRSDTVSIALDCTDYASFAAHCGTLKVDRRILSAACCVVVRWSCERVKAARHVIRTSRSVQTFSLQLVQWWFVTSPTHRPAVSAARWPVTRRLWHRRALTGQQVRRCSMEFYIKKLLAIYLMLWKQWRRGRGRKLPPPPPKLTCRKIFFSKHKIWG